MKNTKKLSAMALTGLMGFSLLGSPVMAATTAQNADTDVYYTSGSTNVDQDGKIIMVVPANMSMTKATQSANTTLTIKTADGTTNFDAFDPNFSVKIIAKSANLGKLQETPKKDQTAGKYKLINTQENNAEAWEEANGNSKADFILFNSAKDNGLTGKKSLSRTLKAELLAGQSDIMEKAAPNTQFKDVITFSVTKITGTNLTNK